MDDKNYLQNRDFIRIEGYPNYVIHQNGTILSLYKGNCSKYNHTSFTKQMKGGLTNGYPSIRLCNNSKYKHYFVHRLLSLAYIPNPLNKPNVDHILGKHMGNDLNNLRWVTQKENMNGFTLKPVKKITKGTISERKWGYQWQYYMNGKRTSKRNKSKEFLIKYRLDLFTELGVKLQSY